mgnify:CR=1 FL=1
MISHSLLLPFFLFILHIIPHYCQSIHIYILFIYGWLDTHSLNVHLLSHGPTLLKYMLIYLSLLLFFLFSFFFSPYVMHSSIVHDSLVVIVLLVFLVFPIAYKYLWVTTMNNAHIYGAQCTHTWCTMQTCTWYMKNGRVLSHKLYYICSTKLENSSLKRETTFTNTKLKHPFDTQDSHGRGKAFSTWSQILSLILFHEAGIYTMVYKHWKTYII